MKKQNDPQHDPVVIKLLGEVEARYPFLVTQLVALHADADEAKTTVTELSVLVAIAYHEEYSECAKDGGMMVGISTHAVAVRLGALVGLYGDVLGTPCQLSNFAVSVWEQVTAVAATALAA